MRHIALKIAIALLAFLIGISAAGIFGQLRSPAYERPAGCRYRMKSEITLPPMPPPAPLAPPAPVLVPSDVRQIYTVDVIEIGKDGKTYRKVKQVSDSPALSR